MKTIVALTAAVAMALAVPAWTQGTGGKGAGRGGPDGGQGAQRPDGPRGTMAADSPASPGAIVYKQLDQLEDELRLAPAQSAAWGAYADALQRLAEAVERARADARLGASGQSNADRQLEVIAAGMRQRSALVQASVDQGRALYALLTPEQKIVADRRLWLPVMLLATGVAPSVGNDVKR